ncbi:hypothetical protein DTO96_101498 [Ephemeroptericola cinctiostellae]|uniref:Uncharacterized protein n=2 Tax=Ephemeroptericola cinctiostellae TaxID=2268024 RepID=A0A345DBM4_9BURK|nr:hypothetical protein DTO96_101498 [Ephemeroptericola cinctiostellae]
MKRIKVAVLAVVMGGSAGAFAQTPWGWNHNSSNQSIQPLIPSTVDYQDVSHRSLSREERARIGMERMETAHTQARDEYPSHDRWAHERAVQMQGGADQQVQMNHDSYDDHRFGVPVGTQFYWSNAQPHMNRHEVYAYRRWRAQQFAQHAQERQHDGWNQNNGHGVFSISFRN